MGVFGAFFGRRGDAGFKAPLLGASRGVVGFTITTSVRPVREKVLPAWSGGGCVREKVRPAHEKWPKNGVFWRAGRSFSRKSRWRGCAGRVFSRTGSRGCGRRPSIGSVNPSMRSYTLWVAWWAARPGHHPSGYRAQDAFTEVGLGELAGSRYLPYLQGNDRGGIPKDPASRCVRWPRCQRRKVGAEKSAPETQHPSLSLATVATGASRRTLSSSTSP